MLKGVLLALALAPLCHCSKEAPEVPPKEAADEAPWDPAALGQDRQTTLRALVARQQDRQRALGAHALKAHAVLTTQVPGRAAKKVEQQLLLRQDAKGQFSAQKTLSPQYGQEVIWQDGWIYARLQHSKFIKRQPRPGEARAVGDRLAGLLPAYVRLLRRFIAVKREGEATLLGRPAVKVALSLAEKPLPLAGKLPPAEAWRRSISVSKLEGHALLDQQSGVPLKVSLEARWTFKPPPPGPLPASGIPQGAAEKTASTVLSFQQQVTALGQVATISPPAAEETEALPLRERLEIERQKLTGELPLDDKTSSTDEGSDE